MIITPALVIGYVLGKAQSTYSERYPRFKWFSRHHGLHIHHSVWLPILAVTGILIGGKIGAYLIYIGLGIFAQHTKEEGLVFVTKD